MHQSQAIMLLQSIRPNIVQAIRASQLGTALVPTYSFVSITEVSEYVPTIEQYGERLRLDGD